MQPEARRRENSVVDTATVTNALLFNLCVPCVLHLWEGLACPPFRASAIVKHESVRSCADHAKNSHSRSSQTASHQQFDHRSIRSIKEKKDITPWAYRRRSPDISAMANQQG